MEHYAGLVIPGGGLHQGNSGPSAKTIIEGAFSAHVGGVGAYAYIGDMLYLEATAYRTLDFGAQNALGTDPFGAPGLIDGYAPYWRAALEPHWGNHYLSGLAPISAIDFGEKS
jgi:hypothetical protein